MASAPCHYPEYQRADRALNRRQLLSALRDVPVSDSFTDVKVIDVTGWEFWYHPGHRALAPRLGLKRWTKSRLIELYAQRRLEVHRPYSPKSLSNYKLERVVTDIAALLREPGSI